ncbi:hypothetical protein M3P05_06095 [Sansalvadorimonas sp. 2012CJ34-2]|uniref:Uncharacterized protein n=1 Tax=Parendozoicomonas callyspongiae TaxID=2942213 RepID=A0ABT0PDR0_9GAMM|nr:hypothetical protein [Sansalvadorimonas sp. 2012CJ34-2]MCL6269510.1 hypothetical protein [Sansalvadorimonas sp. 2012CJ34-2]
MHHQLLYHNHWSFLTGPVIEAYKALQASPSLQYLSKAVPGTDTSDNTSVTVMKGGLSYSQALIDQQKTIERLKQCLRNISSSIPQGTNLDDTFWKLQTHCTNYSRLVNQLRVAKNQLTAEHRDHFTTLTIPSLLDPSTSEKQDITIWDKGAYQNIGDLMKSHNNTRQSLIDIFGLNKDAKLDDICKKAEELSKQNGEHHASIKELRQQNGEYHASIEELSKQNSGYHASIKELSQQNGECHASIEELRQQNSEYQISIEELKNKQTSADQYMLENLQLQAKVSELEENLKEMKEKLQQNAPSPVMIETSMRQEQPSSLSARSPVATLFPPTSAMSCDQPQTKSSTMVSCPTGQINPKGPRKKRRKRRKLIKGGMDMATQAKNLQKKQRNIQRLKRLEKVQS